MFGSFRSLAFGLIILLRIVSGEKGRPVTGDGNNHSSSGWFFRYALRVLIRFMATGRVAADASVFASFNEPWVYALRIETLLACQSKSCHLSATTSETSRPRPAAMRTIKL